jgi:hypothetical protein
MGITKNKRGFEMSFSMIFSLLAGGIILFLAIYATTKFINQGQQTTNIEAAKSIDNYLGDLVTDIASGASTKINFRKETRVLFGCDPPDDVNYPFGRQTIGFSEESGIGQKWYNSTNKITRKNKYIFADNVEQGKKMFIFIKPFYMGFKVDDLIIMSSNNYCFDTSSAIPLQIRADLENLQMENVHFADTCGSGNITVCFGSGGCNITVQNTPSSACLGGCNNYEVGSVSKEDGTVEYVGNLLYGAIFSSKDIYDCNVARLGKKTATLAELYLGKISQVPSGCGSSIGGDLSTLMGAGDITSNFKYQAANHMDNLNVDATCKIYPGESYGNV